MRYYVQIGDETYQAFPVQHSQKALARAAVFTGDIFGPGMNKAILRPLRRVDNLPEQTLSVREMGKVVELKGGGLTVMADSKPHEGPPCNDRCVGDGPCRQTICITDCDEWPAAARARVDELTEEVERHNAVMGCTGALMQATGAAIMISSDRIKQLKAARVEAARIGYMAGHDDTVESRYGDPQETAEDICEEMDSDES